MCGVLFLTMSFTPIILGVSFVILLFVVMRWMMDIAKMLEAARDKANRALMAFNQTVAAVEYAEKNGLKTLKAAHQDALTRQRGALKRAEDLVKELEGEVERLSKQASLPLEKAGKASTVRT